ncbi:2-hydroxychromene-2-carboxylate isomerase [Thermocatellispora tengchongensis]|uniref:2-hydroxychromene-2-carboxylate isomerase n=1 Tax=Thermocatellispora tengchongensis TaxID=1073253 RepID=A0A840P8Y2_9ACTN|nr:hypothetical protein [Thermocatellispora tengchongensis]MBB5136128.1 2-hydroxychromene-2-carboxylate isomerase [Thermocatellispora tengchongensis]
MTPSLTAQEAARWADRAGLPLARERHAVVAATADHIRAVVSTLRELDLGETAPGVLPAGWESADVAG